MRRQLEHQRTNLAALYQRTGMALQPAESAAIEAHIRELHEQMSSQTTLIGSLTLERSHLTREVAVTRRQYEAQARAVADAQFEQNSFNETRVSLPPSSLPEKTISVRFSLLSIAFTISLLAAFGTVVLLHKVAGRKFGALGIICTPASPKQRFRQGKHERIVGRCPKSCIHAIARPARTSLSNILPHRHLLRVTHLRSGILHESQNSLVRRDPPLRSSAKYFPVRHGLDSFHIQPIQFRLCSGILFLHHDSWLSLAC